jgi:hypothetical protein
LENSKPVNERSVEQTVSQTFSLYSRNFARYLIPFLAAGILTGLVTLSVRSALNIYETPLTSLFQQLLGWFPSFETTSLTYLLLSGIINWIINMFATGIAIKFTSDMLERGQANLQASFNFTLTKILYLLAASVITTVLIAVGAVALIIPGIILAIIFFLVAPVIMLEGTGFWKSFSVSISLVSKRWLNTFAFMLVIGIILAVASFIVVLVSAPFGLFGPVVSGILLAFITPVSAIAATLYYYSMKARTMPLPPPPPPEQA